MNWISAGGLISPVLFILYVKDIPTPSRHIELAQYGDDTALVATFKHPALPVKYLEIHLSDLKIGLRDLRIVINVGKSAAVIFTTRHIPPLRFLREEILMERNSQVSGGDPG